MGIGDFECTCQGKEWMCRNKAKGKEDLLGEKFVHNGSVQKRILEFTACVQNLVEGENKALRSRGLF